MRLMMATVLIVAMTSGQALAQPAASAKQLLGIPSNLASAPLFKEAETLAPRMNALLGEQPVLACATVCLEWRIEYRTTCLLYGTENGVRVCVNVMLTPIGERCVRLGCGHDPKS